MMQCFIIGKTTSNNISLLTLRNITVSTNLSLLHGNEIVETWRQPKS